MEKTLQQFYYSLIARLGTAYYAVVEDSKAQTDHMSAATVITSLTTFKHTSAPLKSQLIKYINGSCVPCTIGRSVTGCYVTH